MKNIQNLQTKKSGFLIIKRRSRKIVKKGKQEEWIYI